MKLCVLENLYGNKTLEESLSILTSLGVHTVEVGAGGYPGKAHCNPAELLADEAKYNAFVDTFKKFDVEIAALACHGNESPADREARLWIEAIVNDTTPLVTPEQAYTVTRILEGIYTSAKTGDIYRF